MFAYGFTKNAATFFHSYLKNWNQYVRTNNSYSVFQALLSGVSKRLILDPLLFNIFLNNLYPWTTKADLLNFADDNTISAGESTIENVFSTLKAASLAVTERFKWNKMMVNPDKFSGHFYFYLPNINDPK